MRTFLFLPPLRPGLCIFLSRGFFSNGSPAVRALVSIVTVSVSVLLGGGALPFHARAQELDLSFAYSTYITDTDLESQLNHYMDVGLDFKYHGVFNGVWSYGAEIASQFSLDESRQNYVAVPDLFIGYKISNIWSGYNFNVVLGRHKKAGRGGVQNPPAPASAPAIRERSQISIDSWSFMDEVWNMGLWQSRVNWDYLQPQQQGLIGSFFTVGKDNWLLTLFLSGLFLPDRGPSVDIREGKVQSASRWFVPPRSEFVVFSQRIEAFYWLEEPYLKNVILNDSVALRFRFGSAESQWFSLAYAYKPVNQIYFKIDGGFSIDQKAVSSVIHYQSFKHSLLSMDFGIKKNIFNFVFSLTQSAPQRPHLPENWIVPTLPQALFFGSYMEMDLRQYRLPVEIVGLNLLYSRFSDPEQERKQTTARRLELDLNINRFRLYKGFSLQAHSKRFYWKDQIFSLSVGYWYSLPEEGGWLNSSLDWQISPRLTLKGDMDILGANNKNSGFFSSYKQNDRVRVKLTYHID